MRNSLGAPNFFPSLRPSPHSPSPLTDSSSFRALFAEGFAMLLPFPVDSFQVFIRTLHKPPPVRVSMLRVFSIFFFLPHSNWLFPVGGCAWIIATGLCILAGTVFLSRDRRALGFKPFRPGDGTVTLISWPLPPDCRCFLLTMSRSCSGKSRHKSLVSRAPFRSFFLILFSLSCPFAGAQCFSSPFDYCSGLRRDSPDSIALQPLLSFPFEFNFS